LPEALVEADVAEDPRHLARRWLRRGKILFPSCRRRRARGGHGGGKRDAGQDSSHRRAPGGLAPGSGGGTGVALSTGVIGEGTGAESVGTPPAGASAGGAAAAVCRSTYSLIASSIGMWTTPVGWSTQP